MESHSLSIVTDRTDVLYVKESLLGLCLLYKADIGQSSWPLSFSHFDLVIF